MSTIFTKIVQGEIPSYKVAETDAFLAFLDIAPLAKGHVLCIPKQEVDSLWDLDESTYVQLFSFAKKVAAGLAKAVPCLRVGVAVIGLEVPHTHIHLVPMNKVADLDFSQPKLSFEAAEMKQIAEAIQREITLS